MPKTCLYTEAQIQESGLLSEERFKEVQAAVSDRISHAYDKDGKPIKNAVIVDLGDGHRTLYPRVDNDSMMNCARRDALPLILTEVELELITAQCLAQGQANREAKFFAKAQHLTEWTEGAWLGDTYYHTMDELLDDLPENLEEWPEYVWAAGPQRVIGKFDAWEVCENMVCDQGWEDMDDSDLHGLKELQAALDKFTEANAGVLSYHTDYKTAVLLEGFKPQA